MRRALPAISIVILILLSLFGILLGWIKFFDHRQQEEKINAFPEYYRGLARGCYEQESINCCLGSVANMNSKNALLVPETGCPKGTRQDRLKCIDSYTWCEPESEKDEVK